MKLTQAQVLTLRRLNSGTRYQLRGDRRKGIEVRFRIANNDRADIACPSLAPLMRQGCIAFRIPAREMTKYYEVELTARGLEAVNGEPQSTGGR